MRAPVCALALISLLLLPAGMRAALNNISVPERAHLQMVSGHVENNGLKMAVAILTSNDTLEQTAQFYRSLWAAERLQHPPGFTESGYDRWLILSRLQQDRNIVVQLDTSYPDRTVGFVSVMEIVNIANPSVDPLFPELIRLSVTRSYDGRTGSTLSVFSSRASIGATAQRSLLHLLDDGWTLQAQGSEAGAYSMTLTKNERRLQVVISRDAAYPAVVVANEVVDP